MIHISSDLQLNICQARARLNPKYDTMVDFLHKPEREEGRKLSETMEDDADDEEEDIDDLAVRLEDGMCMHRLISTLKEGEGR